jgi:hypothetical protein
MCLLSDSFSQVANKIDQIHYMSYKAFITTL